MPKQFTLTALAVLLITPILFQLSTYGVSAVDPVTPPVTIFNLVGNVTYKQLGRLVGNTQRITPAGGVEVTVEGFFDRSKKYEVTTDSNGNYSLDVPAGLYSVEVDDDSSTKSDFFVPPFTVKRTRDNGTTHANFQGLVFP